MDLLVTPRFYYLSIYICICLVKQVTHGAIEHDRPPTMGLVDSVANDLDLAPIPVAEVYLASESENLTLLSGDGNSEILIKEKMIVNNQGFHNVVLVCNAFYPIQWIYQGDGAPTRMFSSEIRTVENNNVRNESSYEYFTTLVLMPERNNEYLTGTYSCRAVNDPGIQTFYHLYFPGHFGFPTIRNRIIRIPNNVTQVIIPCMATNPQVRMSIYKLFPKEEASNWTNNTALVYSPRSGFTMDLSKVGNPYGTYYCSINGQPSFWKIDLIPRKEEEVHAEPNSELVEQNNFRNESFRCMSKEAIKIMFPNSLPIGVVDYAYNLSHEFPYFGTLQLDPNFPIYSSTNFLKIDCVTERTRRTLHSWEFSRIGNDDLSIKYDKGLQRILCCTKSGRSPTYEFVKCETRTDCGIKRSCFENGRCEYPFPPKYVDAPVGCVGVEFQDRIPTHVAKCSVGDMSRIVPISENIQRDDILIDEGVFPPTESILKLTTIKNTNKSEVKFKCSGSVYFFSTNFIFALEKIDGMLEYSKSDSIELAESHEPVLQTKMDSSVRRIICFAPLTFSSEWRNVSMPISISEPTKSRTSLSSSSTTTSRAGFLRRRT